MASSNWFAENSPPTPGVSSPQALGQAAPAGQAQQGDADYKTEFMQAVQTLGIDPHQLRANPALMDKVSNYLTQKYPGQQWANGGQKAGDWFSVNGQGFDVLPAGDANFQWLSDNGGPGGGNPNDPSGFQTGTFTGGGQYPLASVMGTGLAQPWTTPFVPPDNLTEQNDPGFQARMKMGTDAIQRSAASRGTLLTGGLLKGLDRYAQDFASQEYGNVYNRALGQYQTAYGIFNNNQGNLFNRLSDLGNTGENAAAGVGNAQIGLGNAQGQGSIAQGNIWGNAINNGVNSGLQYLNQKYQQPNPATYPQGMYVPDSGGLSGGGVNIIAPSAG